MKLIDFQNSFFPADIAVIAGKAIIKYPTTPQTRHYTTL